MATPRRRSKRLHGNDTPRKHNATVTHLAPVEEHSDLPQPSLIPKFTAAESPGAHDSCNMTDMPSTPSHTPQIRPDHSQMHPDLHQSSIAKLSNARSAKAMPYTFASPTRMGQSSKSTVTTDVSAGTNMSSPRFDFKFKRPSTDMSSEAQKIMEGLREKALRVKEEMLAQRDIQSLDEADEDNQERKIKSAKGKMGRYSDVHLQEFKKMNSIANHASAFRTDPSRSIGMPKSLKRTASKIDLKGSDEPSTRAIFPSSTQKSSLERSNMAKRFKSRDIASAKASSTIADSSVSGDPSTPSRQTTATTPSSSNFLTPTKSSLARSASVKSLTAATSRIPAPVASQPSDLEISQHQSVLGLRTQIRVQPVPTAIPDHTTKDVASIATGHNNTRGHGFAARTAPSLQPFMTPQPTRIVLPQANLTGAYNIRSTFASGFNHVKSILRRPQPRFSNDPVKIAAGTHIATPRAHPKVNQDPGSAAIRVEKHVNFTPEPDAIFRYTPRPTSPPTPSPLVVEDGEGVAAHAESHPVTHEAAREQEMPRFGYPSIPDPVRQPTTSSIRAANETSAFVSTPGDFTFRAGQTLSFTSPEAAQKCRPMLTPTIRRVCAGDTSATTGRPVLTGSLVKLPTTTSSQRTKKPLRPLRQELGMSAAKRKRGSDDFSLDEVMLEKENKRPRSTETKEEAEESPKKKYRLAEPKEAPPTSTKLARSIARPVKTSVSGRPTKTGFMSLARLNALAQPKQRD